MPRSQGKRLLLGWALVSACVSGKKTVGTMIRFLDEDGAERLGSYVGDASAVLLSSAQLNNENRWEVAPGEPIMKIARLLKPVDPPYVLGIGLNYYDHINATNSTTPLTPSVFFKGSHSAIGPDETIQIPDISSKPDYEGELGIVIGPDDCKDVSEDDAIRTCVLGYTICHDVSARCLQNEEGTCPGNGGQFSFSKSFDTHAPFGPQLVSTAVLGNASDLLLQTRVNGDLRQNESTSSLIFGVSQIVSFMSSGTTLPKNTLICSGTPDGVGDTQNPPTYLQDGDIVQISIAGIGTLSNPVSRASSNQTYQHFGRIHFTPLDLDIALDTIPYTVAESSY